MMTFYIISLILAGILCIADYLTEHILSKRIRADQKLLSFSSGVAIAYITLDLLPLIGTSAVIEGRSLFIYVLVGFVGLNIIEQIVFKGMAKRKNLPTFKKNLHLTYFFFYNFLLGVVLVDFAAKGLTQALLFFVPFLLYIVAELMPQQFDFKSHFAKILYSLPPFIGAVAGLLMLELTLEYSGELIAFITGTLLYIVIRESLPSNETEKPLYFLIGVLFYTLVIFLSWNLV